MRKANKIVMMTVAILLSAVLLTTSALSGTLAKYVTSGGSYSDSARVAKWGVTVKATVDPKLVNMARNGSSYNDNSVGYTFNGIQLAPGDSFPEAVKFEIGGTAEVALRVKVFIDIYYKHGDKNSADALDNFWVKNGIAGVDITDGTEGDTYMPIGITFKALDTDGKLTASNLYQPWSTAAYYNTERYNQIALCTKIDIPFADNENANNLTSSSNKAGYLYKDFKAGDPIVFHPVKGTPTYKTNSSANVTITEKNENIDINEFYFGFHWPETKTGTGVNANVNYDELCMYLTEVKDPAFTVNFKIEIEQLKPQ